MTTRTALRQGKLYGPTVVALVVLASMGTLAGILVFAVLVGVVSAPPAPARPTPVGSWQPVTPEQTPQTPDK